MGAGGAVGLRSLAGLGVELFLLGDYWRPDCDERTEIGCLVHRAKDHADAAAADELAGRFTALAGSLPDTPDGAPRLLVPVPSTPPLDRGDGWPPLAAMLAESLASAGAGEFRPHLVVKDNATPRLRHVDPERRAEVAAAAGYLAGGAAVGRHIVVVDDVVLTGTTLRAVAACLHDTGAASVTAAAAVRTRLR